MGQAMAVRWEATSALTCKSFSATRGETVPTAISFRE
ncbi:MAG: hypothetical protein QG574_3722 [Cyanobacteriota bacterium erpe_2018_sw_21hr_WHONDRS-SW48-000092_B_bin.40]|nr:hypothetical protein [Cyanobacteriota bacterium erpe_2018_sw_21hr_WHONDRS-SW48-000092_B_bin.40]